MRLTGHAQDGCWACQRPAGLLSPGLPVRGVHEQLLPSQGEARERWAAERKAHERACTYCSVPADCRARHAAHCCLQAWLLRPQPCPVHVPGGLPEAHERGVVGMLGHVLAQAFLPMALVRRLRAPYAPLPGCCHHVCRAAVKRAAHVLVNSQAKAHERRVPYCCQQVRCPPLLPVVTGMMVGGVLSTGAASLLLLLLPAGSGRAWMEPTCSPMVIPSPGLL